MCPTRQLIFTSSKTKDSKTNKQKTKGGKERTKMASKPRLRRIKLISFWRSILLLDRPRLFSRSNRISRSTLIPGDSVKTLMYVRSHTIRS